MAEVVDSIIVELIARADSYVANFDRASAAHDRFKKSVDQLKPFDLEGAGASYAARRGKAAQEAAGEEERATDRIVSTRKRRSAEEIAADKAAKDEAKRLAREAAAVAKAEARELAAVQKAEAKAAADVIKAAEREKAAAARQSAKEQAAAAREVEAANAAQARAAEAAAALQARLEASSARRVYVDPRVPQASPGAIGGRTEPGSRAVAAEQTAIMARTRVPGDAVAAGEVEAEREVNHLLADRASLQARATVAAGDERKAIQDQLTELRLIDQYKRAGLTADEAALRVESDLAAVEAGRTRQAAEQAAIIEKQLRAQSGKVADKVSLLVPALVGGITATELSHLNDEYIRFSNSLKVAGVSALAFDGIQDHLLKTSTRTGTDIGALSDTYRSIALASKDLGASQSDILKVTDAVANSLRITGASGGNARAAILQLGHAFETGKVTAREFNGLALNAYPILQAAAAGSDKYGGSVAKLRAALIAGDLSSREFFQDVLKGSQVLEDKASKAALTTAQGFTALKSALVVYVGSSDQSLGVSAALGEALRKIADNIGIVIPAIVSIGTALAIGYASRAIQAATETKNLGQAILTAFGGPAGLAVTALTLAIGGLYAEFAREDAVMARVNQSFDEVREKLQAAGDSAGLAAIQTVGVGTAATNAIPGVENLTGKVRGLANELFRQADAAKKARIETAASAAATAEKQEREAAALLPAERNRGDNLAPGGIFNFHNYGRIAGSVVAGARNLFSNNDYDKDAKDTYSKAVAVNQQARRDLAAAYQSRNGGDTSTTLGNPRQEKALANAEEKLTGLRKLAESATGKRLENINRQIQKSEGIVGDLKQGVSASAASAAESGTGGRGRRGPSAETLAKRAETARVRGVREDEAYTNALKQAQGEELQAQADLTNDTKARAALERQRINDATNAFLKENQEKGPKSTGGTGERTAGQVRDLADTANFTRAVRLAGVDLEERRQAAADALELDRDARDAKREELRSQLDLAGAGRERLKIALQLLDLEYQQRAADLNATLAPDSKAAPGDKAVARQQLARLPADRKRAEDAAKGENLTSGQRYAKGLNDFDKNDFITDEETKALDGFNKGLDQTIAKTLHLHGIFGEIVNDLIDVAVKQALIRPLANALFGGDGGSSGGSGGGGGLFGSIASAIGGALHIGGTRAAGGPVVGGQLYQVNELGVELFRPSQSGTIYPNNSPVAGAGGGVTVIAPQHYDLTGVVMTEDLVKRLRADNHAYADKVAAAAGVQSLAAAPGRVQQVQTRRN